MDGQEVCRALGICRRTLQFYRSRGTIPFSCVGRKYFYRERDVAAYLESKTQPAKE
ncbi:MAG: helix-turn-helix domain-containing protein [Rikenellaceae bacterium]|nr:helix-turn-helix domain-containing protein [Rikenellaceae bacterium]